MNKQTLARVLSFTKKYSLAWAGALAFALIQVTLTLLAPVLVGRAIDFIVGPGAVDFQAMSPILVLLAGCVALASLFGWLMTRCTNRIAYGVIQDLRTALMHKLQTVPISYIDSHAHGDTISRMISDVDQIGDGLLQGFAQLFTGVLTIVGTLVLMLLINPAIALVVICITPLSLLVASFIAKRSHATFQRQAKHRGEMGAYIEEMLGNQKLVTAFAYGERAQEGFEQINEKLHKSGVVSHFYSAITNPCTRFVNGIVFAAVGVVGAFSALGGTLSVGQLSSFLSYANQYTKPFNEISGVIAELQTALASARRVFEVLDAPNQTPDEPCSVVLKNVSGEVVLDEVCFSYDKSKPLLQNVSVRAKPGQRIAIVGPTGCGKTTLINLLMRFYDADRGAICLDSVPVQSATRDSVRKSFGMVLQDTWLQSGTVRENIAYGKPDASQEDIERAAKAAHCHGFIMRLPHGYDTVLGQDAALSQGERQLLCIARVMLTNPPMLILDEATSSIDTRTELQIQSAFAKMMQGHTSFIVAHRLSTIQSADCILVMRDGNIVEQGTHAQLLEKNGFYSHLYQSQFAMQNQTTA